MRDLGWHEEALTVGREAREAADRILVWTLSAVRSLRTGFLRTWPAAEGEPKGRLTLVRPRAPGTRPVLLRRARGTTMPCARA